MTTASAARRSGVPDSRSSARALWLVPVDHEGMTRRTRILHPTWSRLIAEWSTWLAASHAPATTIGTRTEHVAWLATWAQGRGPWQLTLEQLVEFMGSREWAQSTRRGVRASIQRFYAWGHATGRTTTNPAAGLPSIPLPHTKLRRPAPDAAVTEAWTHASPRERLMIRLAAELGMRRGEVAVVHALDLFEDLAGWSLLVHGKGGRERLLPLSPEMAATLRHELRHGGYLFPGDIDGHLSPRWVGKLMTRLLPDGVTMHALRHRFATGCAAEGVRLEVIQELLGHTNINTTRGYVDVNAAAKRAAINATRQRLAA